MSVRLINGDCRDVLRTLPANTFDACIADPPYGDTSLDWDRLCAGWIPEVARVLKPASSIWAFGSMRFLAPLFSEMAEHGYRYSQDIVWEKQNGSGLHADRFRRVHEHAVLFYRGRWGDVYHNAQYTPDAVARTVRRKQKPAHWGVVGESHYRSEDGGQRMMRSVIYVRNEHGRAEHPTQKPLRIIEPLVRYSVPSGGSYIVPFAGSGSELLVAQALGIDAIGIELNPDYIEIAKRRIAGDAPLFAEVA
jgi:site-specific DNA-methyltransferase (adenine-specific)